MEISKTLRKRYYLVEKAKNASIIGERPVSEAQSGLASKPPAGHRKMQAAASLPRDELFCLVSRRTGMHAGRECVLHCSACCWHIMYAWPLLQSQCAACEGHAGYAAAQVSCL